MPLHLEDDIITLPLESVHQHIDRSRIPPPVEVVQRRQLDLQVLVPVGAIDVVLLAEFVDDEERVERQLLARVQVEGIDVDIRVDEINEFLENKEALSI